MAKTLLIIMASIIAFYIILIAIGQAKNPFSKTLAGGIGSREASSALVAPSTTASEALTDTGSISTCTLTDAYGRSVTLSGDVNDVNFQRLCRLPLQQQVYLYNYPYFISRRGFHGHHGGGMHH